MPTRSPIKNVDVVQVQEKGLSYAVSKCSEIVSKMCEEAEKIRRTSVDFSGIKVAIKCGAPDSTSGIISNPVAGRAADLIIGEGGTVIFDETTGIIGAERILAKRAVNDDVARKMYISEIEERAMSMGVDMHGAQPTGGISKMASRQ
ncbi:MAG: UxaA family hydrolase [Candidatus Bathyarchaeia archaeon]